MNFSELKRVNWSLGLEVITAYFKSKVLRQKLSEKQNEVLAYFRYLTKLNIYHKKKVGSYFLVESSEYGQFYLRTPLSSDYKVFKQIFLTKEYLELARLIEANCANETITMIDGGANIGLTTIYLNHFFKGKKKIKSVLVEPFKDNIELAKLNIEIQGIGGISYEKAGLHNKKCFLKIDQSYRDGKEWSIQIVESSIKTDLPSIEIREIIDKHHMPEIDVLKLDIEGAERFLFEDESYASAFLSKVRVVAIEIHTEYPIEDKILETLKKNNFESKKHLETYLGVKKPGTI